MGAGPKPLIIVFLAGLVLAAILCVGIEIWSWPLWTLFGASWGGAILLGLIIWVLGARRARAERETRLDPPSHPAGA
jgi:hypothetical protein